LLVWTDRVSGEGWLRPIEILLVEDDLGDETMTRAAFELGSIANRLIVARDGYEAIDCLRRGGPDLVLLDLLLPRRAGAAVLGDIRSDPDLSFIPVIALTSSEREVDHWRARGLLADGYLVKPVDPNLFLALVRQLDGLAIEVVRRS
jgi:CheY-like chemotaxis protein